MNNLQNTVIIDREKLQKSVISVISVIDRQTQKRQRGSRLE
jgi:hypothetical protein